MVEKKDRKGRVAVHVRLPESLAKRLEEEAEQRVVGKDLLVQRAVGGVSGGYPAGKVKG